MEKSYVGMCHKVCPVCHEKHDEVVLLNNRMKDTLERDNMIGYALCLKHKEMAKEYVVLVEVTQDPNTHKGAAFTGNVAHVKWEAADRIFNVPMQRKHPFVFVEPGVIAKLQAMTGEGA